MSSLRFSESNSKASQIPEGQSATQRCDHSGNNELIIKTRQCNICESFVRAPGSDSPFTTSSLVEHHRGNLQSYNLPFRALYPAGEKETLSIEKNGSNLRKSKQRGIISPGLQQMCAKNEKNIYNIRQMIHLMLIYSKRMNRWILSTNGN